MRRNITPAQEPEVLRRKFNKKEKLSARIENLKEIEIYPPAKCVVEGCGSRAVGKYDVCKKHGGNPIVEQNLLKTYEIADILLEMSKFDPAFHPLEYIKLAQQGLSEVEIASRFGVSASTLRGWGEKFEDFFTASEIGKACHEAWWLQEGKRNLDNRNYNTGLFKFLTANKIGFSDKMETRNLHVTAGVLAVPIPAKTMEEWEADYAIDNRSVQE